MQQITFSLAESRGSSHLEAARATCRICGSSSISRKGEVEYISGYSWGIYDCVSCGCRFTKHDEKVHDLLHETGAISYYRDYRSFANRCQLLFDRGDVAELQRCLCAVSKYKFVIDHIANERAEARILEVGSSRGYLTSFFLLRGRDILGVDVSQEAVAGAQSLYGNHFAVVGDPAIEIGKPYDVIYHVGLIGCVADPVNMTHQLLDMLRPGGKLLFNAPNRNALHFRDQLWLDSAPPPDLVTLFPQGFWKQRFSQIAQVVEAIESVGPEQAFTIGLHQLFRRRWQKPEAKHIQQSDVAGHAWVQDYGTRWRLFERVCSKAGRVSGLSGLLAPRPADFGLFVVMKRK